MNILLFVMQISFLTILTFGDIGFDHPGRFGLSYNHGFMFSFFYIVTLISGIAFSIRKKSWRTAVPQVLLPLVFFAYSVRPAPHYRVQDYQHLTGKPKSYVKETLSSRMRISGMTHTENGDIEFDLYRGITVHYGVDGTVKKVAPNER